MKNKIAFIFPGQGAQYVGMAKEFYEAIPDCKEVFKTANEVLDFDVEAFCFEENTKINETEYTQAILLTACLSILRAVKQTEIKPDYVAGLSLGEYAALVAAGVLTEQDAIGLVRKRGMYMASEVPTGLGGMAAVLDLDGETVERICKEVEEKTGLIVQPANYNCPGQIVISGHSKAIEEASVALKEAKAKRVLPLTVSGPFHSKMLVGAGEKLEGALDEVVIGDVMIPYTTNVTGQLVTDKENVKPLLVKQVSSGVKWQQCIETLLHEGVTTFIEIGPGKTLSGFLKKIDRTKQVLNIETIEDLKKLHALTEAVSSIEMV